MNEALLELPKLHKGRLLARPNRFLGIVELEDGQKIQSFVADPGRLTELLFPGAEVYVAHTAKEGRKTQYDMALVKSGQHLVSIDSRIPNKLVKKALSAKLLSPFKDYEHIRSEPTVKAGRLDFLLTGEDLTSCYLEVKSCTLVIDNIAMFPDAPTVRGARHLGELIELKKEGFRSCVVFIIQHPDAKRFAPNEKTDPLFAKEFYRALENGVEIYLYKCDITTKAIKISESIPIIGQTS